MKLMAETQLNKYLKVFGVMFIAISIFSVAKTANAQFDSYYTTGYAEPSGNYTTTGYAEPANNYYTTGYAEPANNYYTTGYAEPVDNYFTTGYAEPVDNYITTGYAEPVNNYYTTGYAEPVDNYITTGYAEPVSYYSSESYYYPSTIYSTGVSYSVGSSYYPSTYYSTGGYYGGGSTYYGGNTSYHYDNYRPQVESLSASCSVNDSNPETGDRVTWSVDYVSGGNGNYSYSWSGDNNLSGSGRTVSKSYSTSGTKNARVTITSGSQTISRNCSTYVSRDYNPPVYHDNLDASCTVDQATAYVGDRVTWSAQDVNGGSGNYSYSWSGTNGLSGDNYSVRKTYNTPGTKYAYLTVRSNGQNISRTCSIYVNDRYNTGYIAPIVTGNGVLLSQVPYTGAISNMKIVLFTLALMLWSAIVTYIVILRKRSKLALATVAVNGDEAEQSAIKENLMSHDNMLSDLETFARSKNVIVSDKALAEIAHLAGNDRKNAETLLTSLANRHANGEGWTTLDLEKVQGAVK